MEFIKAETNRYCEGDGILYPKNGLTKIWKGVIWEVINFVALCLMLYACSIECVRHFEGVAKKK